MVRARLRRGEKSTRILNGRPSAGFFACLAAAAYAHPSFALFVPAVSAIMIVMRVAVRPRAELRVGGFRLGVQTAFVIASGALVVAAPRLAFAVPLVAAVETLRWTQTDDRFVRSDEKIRFTGSA